MARFLAHYYVTKIPEYAKLSASSYIPAGGATPTTRRLSIPSGKGSGDFLAGRISDDTNPLASIDLANNQFTELEWSVELTNYAGNGDAVEFRVTNIGTDLYAYTYIPKWTVQITPPSVPLAMNHYRRARS